ncbi:ANTAR domain-containing protein [Micromonospora sp. WMMD998]|uniref:ANTAR domain-containing protein n=1 Tax=Micromonospora sp. WMMD998 TaxID=3016092 RepID=UPI00249BD3D9|nr:ANTAR domain-containing protein [Micromonospora sp. WMMD998]WFE39824.1 ANTAR domain-containing protein [Micromonospora sp. WMMD998]
MTRRRAAAVPPPPLVATVQRLQRELDALRRERRAHAVVEQATGLLIARQGCSPEEAFARLRRISQHSNIRLVDVAAGLLGAAAPPPSAPPPPPEPFRPERYLHPPAPRPEPDSDGSVPLTGEAAARYHLARAAMATAGDANALAETLAGAVRHLGADSTLLGLLEPDGAVRLVGSYGLPPSVASMWQRAPGTVNMALLRAAVDGDPLWLTRDEARRRGYDFIGGGAVRVCLPLRRAGRTIGVAAISWGTHRDLDDVARAYLSALAEVAGRRLSALSGGVGDAPAAHWLEAVLDVLPGSVAWWSPVRDDDAAVVDFRLDRCGPDATDGAERGRDALTGRRLLELHPSAADDGIVAGCARALRDGRPFHWGPGQVWRAGGARPARVLFSLRAVPFGDGLLASWHYHDEQRRAADRTARLERAGAVGWVEWDLAGDSVAWSSGAYRVLGRDPADGPLPLGALHRWATPPDAPRVRAALRALIERAEPAELEFTVRRRGAAWPVRLVVEPVMDPDGRVVEVHGAVARR